MEYCPINNDFSIIYVALKYRELYIPLPSSKNSKVRFSIVLDEKNFQFVR